MLIVMYVGELLVFDIFVVELVGVIVYDVNVDKVIVVL